MARGKVGLIISGYTFVRPDGKGMPGKMGIHTDDFEKDFKRLTRSVHAAGGAIAIQAYAEAVGVMIFFKVGELLQDQAKVFAPVGT
ncbi:MAG: hypothetical protein P8Z67_05050 [Gammaproteobacteria bacterium]